MEYLLLQYSFCDADYSGRQPQRSLNDEELDSGDDLDRNDRAGDRMDYEAGGDDDFRDTVNIMDLCLARAPEPATTDGEVSIQLHP